MRAHDNLGLAADDLQQRALVLRCTHLAGEQSQPQLVGQVVTQGFANRAHVLRCQHLCWRKQGRLPAALSHRNHRANGNQGFSRTNLALKHSMHRVLLREVAQQRVAHLNLTGREGERQLLIEVGQHFCRDSRCGHNRGIFAATLEQRCLQKECLVKPQGVSRGLPVGFVLWAMNQANGLLERKQAVGRHDLSRQFVFNLRHHIEQNPKGATNHPGGHL